MIHKRALLLFGFLALLLTSFPADGFEASQADLDLPRPKGCHQVGTRTVVLRDQRRSRSLLVTLWYPALRGSSPRAPYLDKKTADALAEAWKLQPNFERHVHPHARLLAPFAQGGPFPVVLLEHGSGVVPAIYTVLAEGLASSGYVVVGTNHPPDSLIAVYPDGHEDHFTPYWPAEADRRKQGEAIGKFAAEILVTDVRFVLDQLQEMNRQDGFWRGHLNLEKLGIVGHSMGGTTAALATRDEQRILAGVNLDGSTWPGMNGDVRPIPLHKPLLFLATEEHTSDPGTRAQEYVGSEFNTYYVAVGGTDHMSFTDTHLVDSRFSRESQPDPVAFERALLAAELTGSLVEEFLGKYLKGHTAPGLDSAVHVDKK